MSALKQAREKAGNLNAEIRQMAETVNDWTGEDEEKWERLNGAYDAQKGVIEKLERAEELEAEHRNLPGLDDFDPREEKARRERDGMPTAADRENAFAGWMRAQVGSDLTKEQEDSCKRLKFNPNRRSLDIPLYQTRDYKHLQATVRDRHPKKLRLSPSEQRDLNVGTDADGGYTVPEDFVRQLEMNMLYFGPMLQVADQIRTNGGEALPWPTVNDTSNSGRLLSEAAAVAEVDPVFSQMVLNAYKYTSDEVLVSFELLEDNAVNLGSRIPEMLGERLGRIQNTQFTTGTGSGQPNGVVTASTAGVTTASATAIADTEILDLEHSLDVAYRQIDLCSYMMHDSVLLYVRKLKDNEGRMLWSSGLADGRPDTLNGYAVRVNNDMASSVATNNITMLFGRFDKYKVRTVNNIRFYRLQERHRENDQDAFLAFVRSDGDLLDAGAGVVRKMTQA